MSMPGIAITLKPSVARWVEIEDFCANCGDSRLDYMNIYTYNMGCRITGKLSWWKRRGSPRLYERDHVWREIKTEVPGPFLTRGVCP